MYPRTRKSPLNFGIQILIRTPDTDHVLLGRHMRSMTALVIITTRNTFYEMCICPTLFSNRQLSQANSINQCVSLLSVNGG